MTAEQCLKHKWLQRRAKSPPRVAPKPLNVPPATFIGTTPSPIPPNIDGDNVSFVSSLPDDDDDDNNNCGDLTGVSYILQI